MPMLLPERPRLGADALAARIAPFAIDRERHPLVVVGIRGYCRDSTGAPLVVNHRDLCDNAPFLHTRQITAAFNDNTDPSRYRTAHGTRTAKGMGSLKPGAWFAHRFDLHKGKYLALCQRAGPVTILRDGTPPYPDIGDFDIDIHRGGYGTTSSLGCQTVHPDQWESFISLAVDQAKRYFGAPGNGR